MKQYNPEILQMVQNYRLIDDVFFNTFMQDNIPGMEYILRIIMDCPDLIVKRVEAQHTIPAIIARDVRFDVFAVDSTGKEYDIEIQNANRGAVPKRARYNSSMLDYQSLAKGEDWNKLPETYVIFITAKDVLKAGLPIYHIERQIKELAQDFQDAAHIIFVNGECKDDSPLGRLMQDFQARDAKMVKAQILSERMKFIKANDSEVYKMCDAVEEYAAKRAAEATAAAEKNHFKDKIKMLYTLVKEDEITFAKAAEMLGMTEDAFRKAAMT